MNDTTDNPLDACELLDGIEAMLDTLAERITRRNQDDTNEATDHDTGH